MWVAMDAPRTYRKMVGSKSGIRLCTFCWEDERKIVFGEYEIALGNSRWKVLACQTHKDREKVREPTLDEEFPEPLS